MNKSGPKRRKTNDSTTGKEVKKSEICKDTNKLNDDDDDDCKIIEQEHPLIVLDMTDNEMMDNELGTIQIEEEEEEFLMRIKFGNTEAFGQLKALLTKGIKDILFTEQKSVDITEEPDGLSLVVKETIGDNDGIFMIDKTPTSTKTPANDINVPAYDSSFSEVIQEDQPVEANANQKHIKRNLCFNCDGEHPIRDCPLPRNHAKIRENRTKFNASKGERYHVNVDQKYSHFLPGVVSPELRTALGLRKDEMPVHVYRMRLAGYPPGWLENAKIYDSGMSFIDYNSTASQTDEAKEHEAQDKFDLTKLISFPGFNVKPKSGTRDESRYHRVPPMQKNQSKEVMISCLSGRDVNPTIYRKRKLIDEPVIDDTANREISEMEIEDVENVPIIPLGVHVNLNEPPLPLEPGELPSPPPPPPSDSINDDNESNDAPYGPALPPERSKTSDSVESDRSPSPTLEDLAERKRLLLAALEESSLLNSTVGDDSLLEHIMATDSPSKSQQRAENQSPIVSCQSVNDKDLIADSKSIENSNDITPIVLDQQKTAPSIDSVPGTPVLDSMTPFATLPAGEKWSVGVSDVIDFENLPESTGKYDKMKTLLNRVRKVVKQMND